MKLKIRTLVVQITAAAIVAIVAESAASASTSLRSGSLPQQVTAASDQPQLVADGFMHKLQDAKIDKIAGEIEKDPKLIDDPNYLAQHPKLADYIQKHPEAKQKIKANPKTFFQNLKDQKS
jgi:hypothetical protein